MLKYSDFIKKAITYNRNNIKGMCGKWNKKLSIRIVEVNENV